MDLVSIDFSLVDLFLIGVGKKRGEGSDFIYRFKDSEKMELQKFIQMLADKSPSDTKKTQKP